LPLLGLPLEHLEQYKYTGCTDPRRGIARARKTTARPAGSTGHTTHSASGAPIWCRKRRTRVGPGSTCTAIRRRCPASLCRDMSIPSPVRASITPGARPAIWHASRTPRDSSSATSVASTAVCRLVPYIGGSGRAYRLTVAQFCAFQVPARPSQTGGWPILMQERPLVQRERPPAFAHSAAERWRDGQRLWGLLRCAGVGGSQGWPPIGSLSASGNRSRMRQRAGKTGASHGPFSAPGRVSPRFVMVS
jgi:hypothetical protein